MSKFVEGVLKPGETMEYGGNTFKMDEDGKIQVTPRPSVYEAIRIARLYTDEEVAALPDGHRLLVMLLRQ